MKKFPQEDYFHALLAGDTPPVFLLPFKRMIISIKNPSHRSSYRNAMKRSAISLKPIYPGMHFLNDVPPSPFFQIDHFLHPLLLKIQKKT